MSKLFKWVLFIIPELVLLPRLGVDVMKLFNKNKIGTLKIQNPGVPVFQKVKFWWDTE